MDLKLDAKLSNIDNDDFSYLRSVLPDGYDSKIVTYYNFSPGIFECYIRTVINSKCEAEEWLAVFEKNSMTSWRSYSTYPEETQRIIFKKDYRCHHNTFPKKKSVPHEKHTNCKAKLRITVKQQLKKSADAELKIRPCEIFLRHSHNHQLNSVAVFILRRSNEEIASMFHDLFNRGHSPSSAWESYKFDLLGKYGNDNYKIAADGSNCPTRKWVHDLYRTLFEKEYGESSHDNMVQKLEQMITSYNEKCGSNCASLISEDGNIIVCICDPFMKQVHENLPSSGEIMFVDSSGNLDRHSSRIYYLLCPSAAGNLPLGVIITFSDSDKVLTTSFDCLKALFPEKAFYGGEYPKIIITDDSSAERNTLSICFGQSRLLLGKFYVLQDAMQYFWEPKHEILPADRQEIFTIFHDLLNTTDCDSFNSKYEDALSSPLINQYDFAFEYFEKMQSRASEWALCYRRMLITRGYDINNYSEANFKILKDVLSKRTKAFSVVQLFSFITVELVDYYKMRLTDVINDKYDGYTKSQFHIPDGKLKSLSYDKLGDNSYCVKNNANNNEYYVNIESSVCSCPVGIQGAPCKHQYFIIKEEKISSPYVLPRADEQAKRIFQRILSENVDLEDDWCESPHGQDDPHMLDTDEDCSPQMAVSSTGTSKDIYIRDRSEDLENRKQSTKETLKDIFDELNEFLDVNPEEFLPALERFSESYGKCKTASAKLTALHTFGHNSAVHPCSVQEGENLQGSNVISVEQTAAVTRKRHVQQSESSPKSEHHFEHDYANVSANKILKVAEHS